MHSDNGIILCTFLLSYDPFSTCSVKLSEEIGSIAGIMNWAMPYRGAIILVSKLDAHRLTGVLRQNTCLSGERFLVLGTQADRNGWLPKIAWEFMHNPSIYTD